MMGDGEERGGAGAGGRRRFSEIDVERINVVGPDGGLRLVLTNEDRAPGGIVEGREHPRMGGPFSGMLFYNLHGDECGGLASASMVGEGRHEAYAALKFDRFRGNEAVELAYAEENGRRMCGLRMDPVPVPGSRGERWRVWLGHDETGEVSVALADSRGRPRIRMCVGTDDLPRLEFLDEAGAVVYAVRPPAGGSAGA